VQRRQWQRRWRIWWAHVQRQEAEEAEAEEVEDFLAEGFP
jgi:hypothetical protein